MRNNIVSVSFFVVVLLLCLVNASIDPVKIPLQSISDTLVQNVLDTINKQSPLGQNYKKGVLTDARKTVEEPFAHVVYKLTLRVEPECNDDQSCGRYACSVNVKQNGIGSVEVVKETVNCVRLGFPGQHEVSENLQQQHQQAQIQDSSDKAFVAVRAKDPKYCAGCPYELNTNLPGLEAFTERIAQSMDESEGISDYKCKVVGISKVTRAVPPGKNVIQYQIMAEVGLTNCLKATSIERSECTFQTNLPIKNCLVTFEEEAFNKQTRKITRNNCTETYTAANDLSGNLDAVSLTEADDVRGGHIPEDNAKIEFYDQIAEEVKLSTSESVAATDDKPLLRVALHKDNSAHPPVGFIDKIREFDAFLEDFDIPVKAASSTTETPSGSPVAEQTIDKSETIPTVEALRERVKRETVIPGGTSSISIEDPSIKQFVSSSLGKYQGEREPLVVKVKSASVQVVAGKLYKINVVLGRSNCTRGIADKQLCQLESNDAVEECEISVWSRPWLDKGEPEIKLNCGESNGVSRRRRRSLRGANYTQKMLQQARMLREENQFAKERSLFQDFMAKHEKSYRSEAEHRKRFKIFRKNLKRAQELQSNEHGTAEYGVTMFSDLSPEEFKSKYLGLRRDLHSDNQIPMPMAKIPDVELPKEFDWRHYNAVTPVKNQGACGSCWAFSVTGNVEGQYAIKHKQLLSLSEQELVDCDKLDDGCGGGLPDNAYRALEDIGGLELESDYPYDGRNEKCHFDKTMARVKVVSGVNITTNETQMQQWLVQNGPISIGINANAMQFYIGGVSHPFKFLCNPKNLDHGVLIVGYGIKNYPMFHRTLPYWTIKNSWGPHWGEQGYYRVYRGDGTCGVNQMATSAVIA